MPVARPLASTGPCQSPLSLRCGAPFIHEIGISPRQLVIVKVDLSSREVGFQRIDKAVVPRSDARPMGAESARLIDEVLARVVRKDLRHVRSRPHLVAEREQATICRLFDFESQYWDARDDRLLQSLRPVRGRPALLEGPWQGRRGVAQGPAARLRSRRTLTISQFRAHRRRGGLPLTHSIDNSPYRRQPRIFVQFVLCCSSDAGAGAVHLGRLGAKSALESSERLNRFRENAKKEQELLSPRVERNSSRHRDRV
jgi:hypothetical protein